MNSRISRRFPVSGELGAPTNSCSSSPALLLRPVARAPCDVRPSAMRVLLRTYVLGGTVPARRARGKHSFDLRLDYERTFVVGWCKEQRTCVRRCGGEVHGSE